MKPSTWYYLVPGPSVGDRGSCTQLNGRSDEILALKLKLRKSTSKKGLGTWNFGMAQLEATVRYQGAQILKKTRRSHKVAGGPWTRKTLGGEVGKIIRYIH